MLRQSAPQDLPSLFEDAIGNIFVEGLLTSVGAEVLPPTGRLAFDRVREFAKTTRFDPADSTSYDHACQLVERFAERVVMSFNRLSAGTDRTRDSGSVVGGSRASASVAGNDDIRSWGGASAPPPYAAAPGTPSTTFQAGKRVRADDESATDDRFAARGAAFVDGPSSVTPAGNPFARDDAASPEMRHFAPLLVSINEARRKLCSAVERVAACMVDIPPEQVLSARSAEFTHARLRPFWSAATSAGPFQGDAQEVLRTFAEIRSVSADLKHTTSRAVRLYWLANQTQGANWDTVAQLVHREEMDAHLSRVMDGYTPIATWDERVTVAMKETHQERHLAKDGTPLGPLCPELLRRRHALQRRQPQAAAAGRGGRQHARGRGGKENVRHHAHAKRGGGGGGRGGARANGAGRPAAPGAAAAAHAVAAAGAAGP